MSLLARDLVMVVVVIVQVAVVVVVKSWSELLNNKLEARASKYKFGPRAAKHKFGVRAVKHIFGTRAVKYKLWARVGKHKLGARASKYKLGARVGGREIQIPNKKYSSWNMKHHLLCQQLSSSFMESEHETHVTRVSEGWIPILHSFL